MSAPKCPRCGSTRLFKAGLRYLSEGTKQRWLCRECGYRFSEGKAKPSFLGSDNGWGCQLCVLEAKKLEPQTETKTVAGESPLSQETKGKIVEFAWWMKKQGYRDGTIASRAKLLRIMMKRGADLNDPETIKEVIAKQEWSEGRKENAVNAYTTYLRMAGGTWNPPIYSRIDKIPFIPKEEEIDALIASCAQKGAALLQTLKETAARVGEAWALKWTDLDAENRTLRLTPEKGSNARICRITPKLSAMLLAMPKKGERVFGSYPLSGYRTCFTRQRKKAAVKLGNPRILRITFHTFRHWKATMEYHKTKDILHVMKLLGHKNIKNTLIYTQLVQFPEDEEFVCKAAKTLQEASKLIESGFEYICAIEDTKLFRKRK